MARSRTNEWLGDALPGLLSEAGMSSRALARAVGVDQAHLSRITNGLMPASGELAARIAEELGLPTDFFPDYREWAVVEAVRADEALRDRIYTRLDTSGRGHKRC